MLRRIRPLVLATAAIVAAACSDSPTAPTPAPVAPTSVDPSIITPLLLPQGADWAMYFSSFNTDRNLLLRVIRYPNFSNGQGSYLIPGVGKGLLVVTRTEPYGGLCLPQATPCDGVTYKIPESAWVFGIAYPLRGFPVPFKVDLHSNLWPNPTNPNAPFDTADLYFCRFTCTFVSHFYGELHHEPQ